MRFGGLQCGARVGVGVLGLKEPQEFEALIGFKHSVLGLLQIRVRCLLPGSETDPTVRLTGVPIRGIACGIVMISAAT